MNLILASKSPRRQALLGQLGLQFEIRTEEIDERMDPALPVEAEVARVSREKAAAVLSGLEPDDVLLCADTVVVLDGRVMGKPKTPAEAAEMLRALSGRTHAVLTAVTVCGRGRTETAVERTEVHFRMLSAREIDAYVRSGEPMDKAGAYGIQGPAGCFVERLEGDYFNVMGLPLCRVTGLLRAFGIPILSESTTPLSF